MKLIRFGDPGSERPGLLLENGRRIDASDFGMDYDEAFFGSNGLEELVAWAETEAISAPEIDASVRAAAPVYRPEKIVCIGLNYKDHAEESGMALPSEPVIFFKSPSALCGPNDNLIIPCGGTKTDWEVELAVIVGKRASYVNEADATSHIAGYAVHNDYSERAFQLEREGQWVKGKSCDTFAPLGPFLATPDELTDANDLKMWLKVNGEEKQNSNSEQMAFKPPFLISYISRFMTLMPGDIISTGTPPGVGLGFDPPQYLQAGDRVELGIEGLGTQKQTVVQG